MKNLRRAKCDLTNVPLDIIVNKVNKLDKRGFDFEMQPNLDENIYLFIADDLSCTITSIKYLFENSSFKEIKANDLLGI